MARACISRIASASPEFGPRSLEGAHLRLIFKPWKDALPEHTIDRLTQVRDNYANLVEESVSSRKLNIFNRFDADITDLLRVDPENDLGRKYWHEMNPDQPGRRSLRLRTRRRAPVGLSAGGRSWTAQAPDQLVCRQPADLQRRVWRRALRRQRLSQLVAWACVHGIATPDKLKASLLKTLDDDVRAEDVHQWAGDGAV